MKPVQPRSSATVRWILAAVLFAGVLLLYLPTLRFEFLNWDDLSYVADNENVKGGLSWTGFVWAFKAFYAANWHPITWLSHMLDCQFFGLRPGGHHFANVLLHSANSALLFLVLLRLFRAGKLCAASRQIEGKRPAASEDSAIPGVYLSFFIAAVFALHPLRVESVAWVSERKDLLSGFFFMLTLWAYAKYAFCKSRYALPSQVSGFKSQVYYFASLLCFALGLMSKPMLVTVPFLLLLIDLWPLDRWRFDKVSGLRSLLFEKLPFFALTAGSCIITFIAQRAGGAVASVEMVPFNVRLENAALACVQYIARLFWPADLSPIYRYRLHFDPVLVLGAVVFLLSICAGVFWFRKSRPWLFVGWFWFLGMLVPVIGVIQVGSQASADRYTYLPLIGFTLGLGWEVADRNKFSLFAKRSAVVVSVILLSLLSVATARQLPYWRNTEALFQRALDLDPQHLQALYALGSFRLEHGDPDGAAQFLERAIKLKPDYPEVLGTMALLEETKGKYREAVQYYYAALRAFPNQDAALNNLAWLLASCPDPAIRDGKEAVRLAARACEITGYSKPLYIGTLGAAYAQSGDFPQAIAAAERAASLAADLNVPETAARNRELIQLYKQGRAAHGEAP